MPNCELNVIEPIIFNGEDVFFENVYGDELSEFSTSVATSGGYKKGQRIIVEDGIWQSTVDNNTVNPTEAFTADKWTYDPSLKRVTFVKFWLVSTTYNKKDLAVIQGNITSEIHMYRSKIDNSTGDEPDLDGADSTNWEFLSTTTVSGFLPAGLNYTLPTWTNKDYSEGEKVWHATQSKGFIANSEITAVTNDPVQTEPPYISDSEYEDNHDTWEYVEPVNRLRLFDETADTLTTGATNLRFVIDVNERFTDLVLLNLQGYEVSITIYNPSDLSTPLFSSNESLYELQDNYYDYIFNQHEERKDIHISGLPPLLNTQIVLVFNGSDGDTGIGSIIAGTRKYLGNVNIGVGRGSISYTDSSVNDYNKTKITRGKFVKKANFPVYIDHVEFDQVVRNLDSVVDKVCYFFGTDNNELGVYGLLQDHNQVLSNSVYSVNNISIKGIY